MSLGQIPKNYAEKIFDKKYPWVFLQFSPKFSKISLFPEATISIFPSEVTDCSEKKMKQIKHQPQPCICPIARNL